MTSLEEVLLAFRAGADAVGFVGVRASPRAVDDETIAAIIARVPPPMATFLLTAEPTVAGIARHVLYTGASTVQLLRTLDAGEFEKLPGLLPETRLLQVVHVENRSALDLIEPYAPYVHAFLLDSGRPALPEPEYGGTGRIHDWSVSAEFVRRSPHPVFLAGGLAPSNVREALMIVRPFGVDVCSGVRAEGRLDPDKLHAFIKAVRSADAELATGRGYAEKA
jgi:phosphoribosylanthranilate isomerase